MQVGICLHLDVSYDLWMQQYTKLWLYENLGSFNMFFLCMQRTMNFHTPLFRTSAFLAYYVLQFWPHVMQHWGGYFYPWFLFTLKYDCFFAMRNLIKSWQLFYSSNILSSTLEKTILLHLLILNPYIKGKYKHGRVQPILPSPLHVLFVCFLRKGA